MTAHPALIIPAPIGVIQTGSIPVEHEQQHTIIDHGVSEKTAAARRDGRGEEATVQEKKGNDVWSLWYGKSGPFTSSILRQMVVPD